MDWDDFTLNNRQLTIETVDKVVEKIKIKFANSPETWLFEFKSILIPINKKIEKMLDLVKTIEDNFTGKDDTELLKYFDNYRFINEKLIASKNLYLKKLEIDLRFMKKFALKDATFKQCEKEFKEFETKLDALVSVSSFYDIPSIQKKIEAVEKAKIVEFASQGINAVETYKSALDAYLSNNKHNALELFSRLSGYRDSDKYVEKLKFVTRFDSILECNGSTYLLQKTAVENEQQNAKKSVTSNFVGAGCLALFNIVDGVQEKTPIVKNIVEFITCYCNKFYFVNDKSKLCCYDLDTKQLTTILEIKGVQVSAKNTLIYKQIGKAIFLGPTPKKTEKSGCFSKSKVPVANPNETQSKFILLCLDLATSRIDNVFENVLCINENFKKDIFFTVGIFDKYNVLKEKKIYHVNVENMVVTMPFNRPVFIEDVVGKNIIYSMWEPNTNNLDLYSYNLETKASKLIEKNIYDYFMSLDDKIYYTVGNYYYQPLYRTNIDGSDIEEISTNCEDVLGVFNGYMYVIRGTGYNRTLIKMKVDGSVRLPICYNFKRIEEIKNGFIYYIDKQDKLHIVRSDGMENRTVAEDVDDVITITEKKIFFLRKEYVGTNKSYGKSLYYMDADGHNLHKAAFDVGKALKFDDNTIYYSVSEKAKYIVKTTSYERGIPSRTDERICTLGAYYALNVNNLDLTRVYLENAPQFSGDKYKTGCRGKKKLVCKEEVCRVEYIYPVPTKEKIVPKEGSAGLLGGAGGLLGNIGKSAGGGNKSGATPGCGCASAANKKGGK